MSRWGDVQVQVVYGFTRTIGGVLVLIASLAALYAAARVVLVEFVVPLLVVLVEFVVPLLELADESASSLLRPVYEDGVKIFNS